MTAKAVTTDMGNGWSRTVTVFDADVTINPEWWRFWRKPRVEARTFTSSFFHKTGDQESVIYGQQLLVGVFKGINP